jgi:hypothetical protein
MDARITRGTYGQIIPTISTTGTAAPSTYGHAKSILAQAIRRGVVDAPYCEVDAKHRGSALNYDLYDFARGVALVQQRHTTCTKYGNSPTKTYLILRRQCGVVTATEAPGKARIAKLAKSGLPWGGVIAAITGRKPATIKTRTQPQETGFKVLQRDGDQLVSVWDQSPWELGKERAERLAVDPYGYEHPTAGLYYYATADEAINAAQHNDIFGTAREHAGLVVCRVRVRGRRAVAAATDYGVKRVATYIRPEAIVATL